MLFSPLAFCLVWFASISSFPKKCFSLLSKSSVRVQRGHATVGSLVSMCVPDRNLM